MARSLTYLMALGLLPSVFGANANDWRSRSIYQIITDRFALPSGSSISPSACDPGAQTWCGGTWASITANLDYIQNAGFTAIWISPVSQNWEGPRTAYGDAYHGYWIQDASKLNERFGTKEDLLALTKEVHRRGMYVMVDVVANNVMASSTTPDYSKYMFKDASDYHSYCPVKWGDRQSEMNCWLGDEKVALPDLNTQSPTVQVGYQTWIKDLVQTYSIDGLRIDAAKHTDASFWSGFCDAGGVFCMGEIFGDDIFLPASYTRPTQNTGLDSVLNYPMYNALVQAFAIPGPGNVTALADVMDRNSKAFVDLTILGNFLENQDNPRWANVSVDPQSMYNAMTFNFFSDGIPIVYYGQEQGMHGSADPWNREPLWPSKYDNTTAAYQLIQKLNMVRNHLVNTSDWATEKTSVLTTAPEGIAILKGNVLSVLTTIGSPPAAKSMNSFSPWSPSTATTDVLTCKQYAVGSGGSVNVEYSQGGRPVVLVPNKVLVDSGICTDAVDASIGRIKGASTSQSGGRPVLDRTGSALMSAVFAAGLMWMLS